MTEFMGELFGTMVLIILGVGVVGGVLLRWSKAENAGWVVITLGWGIAVSMGVFISGTVSDARINPAGTIGMAANGNFPRVKGRMFIGAQMLGESMRAANEFLKYLPHWRETKDKATKLAVFATHPGSSDIVKKPFQNLLSEMIGTFVLLFVLLFFGGPSAFTEGLFPLVVGLLIIVIGLSLGGATGYAINPARDLGPRIAHAILPIPQKGHSDWGYSWIPVVGPIIGGIYGALVYNAVFHSDLSASFWAVSGLVLLLMIIAVRNELRDTSARAA